ncbi:hypothetical protein SEA_NEDARYA_92 [Gordonia phage Nedarya]|nr:hypothetical protein SEA_NEDARYA_92 [Gordonia phage Nedarya]
MAKISVVIPDHGTYECSDVALDLAIERFLPASQIGLSTLVNELTGIDYRQESISTLLVMLASFYYSEV